MIEQENFVSHADKSIELETSHHSTDAQYELTEILPQSASGLKFLIPRQIGEIKSIDLVFELKNSSATVNLSSLKLPDFIDKYEIKRGDTTVDTTYIKDEYKIIAPSAKDVEYFKFTKDYCMIDQNGFVGLDINAGKSETRYFPLLSILEKTHVAPSKMANELYIEFHTKPVDDLTLQNAKLVIWYDNNLDCAKSSTRQRVLRGKREYTTVSTGQNKDVDIILHNGVKDCVAIAVLLKDSTEAKNYQYLDLKKLSGDVCIKIGECRINRSPKQLIQYAQTTKDYGLIRLTPGYNDFEKVLQNRRHLGGREIPYGNNNTLSFNVGTVINGNKNLDVTVIYFAYETVKFNYRSGVTIV